MKESNRRSNWCLHEIVDNPEYQKLQARLPLATSYKPRTYGKNYKDRYGETIG